MKALLIEDAGEVVESITLCITLRWPESVVRSMANGSDGLRVLETDRFDIVLLDLGLPDCDGQTVLAEIRRRSDVPVVVVSALADDATRVSLLENGADDFIPKPFIYAELLARVGAVMRRTATLPARGWTVTIPGLSIDLAAGRASVDGRDRDHTATEWKLLSFLARNAGRVLDAPTLAANVWGTDVERSAVKMCIRRLRQKLGDDTKSPHIILSHRRRGYSLELGQ